MTPSIDISSQPDDLPPMPSRMFEVASGLDTWTPEEAGWMAANPRWQAHFARMETAVAEIPTHPSVVVPDSGPHDRTLYLDAESSRHHLAAEPKIARNVRVCLRDRLNEVLLQIISEKPDGTTGIRLWGVANLELVVLRLDGVDLELVTGFNKHGYATLRTTDADAIIKSKAVLIVERARGNRLQHREERP